MKFRKIAVVSALALTLTMGACSSDADDKTADDKTTAPDTTTSEVTGELTVYAAASLNTAFPEIADEIFAEQYPDVDIQFAFEGSSSLAEKLLAGSPADVFASANVSNMDKVADLTNDPIELTKNTLRLIVPAGNPAGITDLESANESNFVICAPQVPCGALTEELAQAQGIDITAVSEEQSVTDVLTKVKTGEADAGLVYITDAMLGGADVEIVDVDGITDVGTSYMIATLADAPSPELAQAFVDAVMSDAGKEIMTKYGFGAEN